MFMSLIKYVTNLFKKKPVKPIVYVQPTRIKTVYCVENMHELCNTMFSNLVCKCDCHWSEN